METNPNENFSKYVEELNALSILQEEYLEDEENEIIQKIQNDFSFVTEGLDIDKHRWYETSISVFKYSDTKFLGVRAVSNIYSETMMVEDCYHTYEFYEMEVKNEVNYSVKGK